MNQKHSIGAIINFCSNDYPFLKPCIDHLRPICSEILVVVCDHFFNGERENLEYLNRIYREFKDISFIQYPFLKESIPENIIKEKGDGFWHTLARWVGFNQLKKETEYVLFLDTDEVVDTERFLQWMDQFDYRSYQALRLSNYWYFRDPTFQAKTFEDSPLLACKKDLSRKSVFSRDERDGIFKNCNGKKKRNTLSIDQKPLFHHYSWVRTKEQMLKKVLSWGHQKDRNWKELVEKEFTHEFSGKDFVHGYDFIKIEPYIQLSLDTKPIYTYLLEDTIPQLKKIKDKELLNLISPSFLLKSLVSFWKRRLIGKKS